MESDYYVIKSVRYNTIVTNTFISYPTHQLFLCTCYKCKPFNHASIFAEEINHQSFIYFFVIHVIRPEQAQYFMDHY